MIISDLLGNQVEVHSRKFGDAVSVEIEILPDYKVHGDIPPKITLLLSAATARKFASLIEDKAEQADSSIVDPQI